MFASDIVLLAHTRTISCISPTDLAVRFERAIVYHSADHCFLRDSLISTGIKMIDCKNSLSNNVVSLTLVLPYRFPTYIHLISIRAIVDLVRALVDGQYVGKQEIGYPLSLRSTRGAGIRAQRGGKSCFSSTS